MLKYIVVCLCLFACTPSQRSAEVAKVQTCFALPEVKDCQDKVLADCVTNDTCESREAPIAMFDCLKVCQVSGDGGAAGSHE